MSVLADAEWRGAAASFRVGAAGVTSGKRSLLGGESTIEANQTGGIEHGFTVRNDRTLGGVVPDTSFLIQSVGAFCCCTV
jgi:hypothetical protein